MDITEAIEQLTAERDRIDRALEALRAIGSPADPTPRPTARRPVQTRIRGQSGTTGKLALTPENVLSLTTKDGVSAAVVRAGIKAGDGQVLNMLKTLESSGRVTRTGNRRSTRWHSVA
jgi:hypothetical protein